MSGVIAQNVLAYLRDQVDLWVADKREPEPGMSQVPKIASLIFLQYPKKEGRDEVDFLLADKLQTSLQVDTVNLVGHGQTCPNHAK